LSTTSIISISISNVTLVADEVISSLPTPVWSLDFSDGVGPVNIGSNTSIDVSLVTIGGTQAILSFPMDSDRGHKVMQRLAPANQAGNYYLVDHPLPSSTYTQTMWLKITASTGTIQNIISQPGNVYLGTEHYLYIDTDLTIHTGAFIGTVGGMPDGYMLRSAEPITTTGWVFVAITYSDTNNVLKLYINGKLTKFKYPGKVPASAFKICSVGGHADAYGLHGRMDQPSIYNTELTPAQVYARFLTPFTAPTTTVPPTTAAPTTPAPTTAAPTTEAPTTLPPTTVAPTTEAPTTLAPTTEAPTTLPPTTAAPTTPAPTTEPPTEPP
jgi:hypothetical protein